MRPQSLPLLPSINNTMATPVKIYRILTYLLLPNAFLYGLIGVLVLIPALMSPIMLFTVFLFICAAIYGFMSLRFLHQGLLPNRPCKPSLKDWVRVNGFVSMVLGIQLLLRGGESAMMSDVELTTLTNQLLDMQPMLKDRFNSAQLISMFKGLFIYFLISGILLVTHLLMSFRLLKVYGYLFARPDQGEGE
jgi:hypothetical protein